MARDHLLLKRHVGPVPQGADGSEPLKEGGEVALPFWDRPLQDLVAEVGSSDAGISVEEAARRLAASGPNELAQHGAGALLEILLFFTNPLVLILLVAAGVSGFVGEYLNASLIAVMVLLSVMLNFLQAYRSSRAADNLRRSVVTTASVLRDGAWVEVPQREVVPGDLVRLAAGDLVPADARLLEVRDLFVNEAALTGESLPAEKTATPTSGRHGLADADNAVFLGTSVISGTAHALVIRTGRATEIGHIAQHLAARPPATEFERGTHGFGLLIMRTVVFLVLFVFLVNAGIKHAPVIESLPFAIALAVGLSQQRCTGRLRRAFRSSQMGTLRLGRRNSLLNIPRVGYVNLQHLAVQIGLDLLSFRLVAQRETPVVLPVSTCSADHQMSAICGHHDAVPGHFRQRHFDHLALVVGVHHR